MILLSRIKIEYLEVNKLIRISLFFLRMDVFQRLGLWNFVTTKLILVHSLTLSFVQLGLYYFSQLFTEVYE
jgi:hypothetical protein